MVTEKGREACPDLVEGKPFEVTQFGAILLGWPFYIMGVKPIFIPGISNRLVAYTDALDTFPTPRA